MACPVGALYEKDDVDAVWKAIQDPTKHVIVQEAPAIRAALGEEFGLPPGSLVTGKMIAALRRLGFDKVFDTNFTADLTIIEEGNELLKRVKEGGTLPMITSCSPGWVNFMEKHYGDYIDHLSSAKSPMEMFGAMAKTYYSKQVGIEPKDIVTVSIMPCTAKKFEAARPEMGRNNIQDIDIVLTTRELTKLIKYVGLNFQNLKAGDFDSPLGSGTGAAVIFGTTGGVMEAALRTVYEKVTGKTLDPVDFADVRGFQGIKEATIDLGVRKVKIAIAHTLINAKKIMEKIKTGTCDYDFIEIMACPGGCIGGGGQPIGTTTEIKKQRMESLYTIDKGMKLRKSHENPDIIALYKDFLGEPLSKKAHDLLHTHYHKVQKEHDFSKFNKK
jgi:NADH-quinone oxidoreductase subunit G/NADP-reducing hydrogenase subunit HndD